VPDPTSRHPISDSRDLSPPSGGTPITTARLLDEIEAARDFCQTVSDLMPINGLDADTFVDADAAALRLDALVRQIRSAGLT